MGLLLSAQMSSEVSTRWWLLTKRTFLRNVVHLRAYPALYPAIDSLSCVDYRSVVADPIEAWPTADRTELA